VGRQVAQDEARRIASNVAKLPPSSIYAGRKDEPVQLIATFFRRWPRTSAMLGFGLIGAALSVVWWTPVIFHARGVRLFLLFVGTPGISAAVAGWILGKPLFEPARYCGPINAALRGAGIASLALLLFAPLFASVYVWTQASYEHWSILNLTLLMLIGSAFVIWWLVAIVGALAGWALSRLASYARAGGQTN